MGWNIAGNIRGPQGPQGPQGAQGVAGAPGATGPAGPAGLNWRGAWAGGTVYAVDDSVGYNGSTFFATAAHPNTDNTPPTNDPAGSVTTTNAGWQILAIEGAVGPQGPQGNQGPQGTQGTQGNTGAAGARGSNWYVGTGVPTTGNTAGSQAGDQYLDQSTGDVYTLS